jgi:hypothetical protein
MDREAKEKIQTLVKSMYKSVKQINKKTAAKAVKDVLDPDRVAEIPADNVSSGSTGVINKSKKDCGCKSCECNNEIKKTENLTKNIIDNFKKITEIYLKKQEELEKAKVDEGLSATQKKQQRKERSAEFAPHKKEKFTQDGYRKMPNPTSQSNLKQKLREKHPKAPSNEDLEYPMAASENRCWEGYEPTPGKKPYSEGSCKKIAKDEKEKPFHGYNKEKHSSKGGLSEKAREKYNKENNANLQAPVSSEEAKKSPKKAARRKSFCARMSGNKGATSKEGKLTPKGAALKRWDC